MEPIYKELDRLNARRDGQYDFVDVCYKKHIVSFAQAKKALNEVHKEYVQAINKLKKQFMKDRAFEALNYN